MRIIEITQTREIAYDYQSGITAAEIIQEKLDRELKGRIYNGIGVIKEITGLELGAYTDFHPNGERFMCVTNANIKFLVEYYLPGDVLFAADIKKNASDPAFINIVYVRGLDTDIPVKLSLTEAYPRANVEVTAITSGMEVCYQGRLATYPGYAPIPLIEWEGPYSSIMEDTPYYQDMKVSKTLPKATKRKYLDPLATLTDAKRFDVLITAARMHFAIDEAPIVVKKAKGIDEAALYVISLSDFEKLISTITTYKAVYLPEAPLFDDTVIVYASKDLPTTKYSAQAISHWKHRIKEYIAMKRVEASTIDNIIGSDKEPLAKYYESKRQELLALT